MKSLVSLLTYITLRCLDYLALLWIYTHITWCSILQFLFTTAGFCDKVSQILIYISFKFRGLGIQEIVIAI